MKTRRTTKGSRVLSSFLSLCLVLSFGFAISLQGVAGADEAPEAPASAESASLAINDDDALRTALASTFARLGLGATSDNGTVESMGESDKGSVAAELFAAYDRLNAEDYTVATEAGEHTEAAAGEAIGTALSVENPAIAEDGPAGDAALGPLDFSPQAAQWSRLSGQGRYETMQAIIQEAYPSTVPSTWAILTNGENFPDALAASGFAGLLDAPVILTTPGSLSPQAASEIQRLGIKNIAIIGGKAAVSDKAAIEAYTLSCVESVGRIGGGNRTETAYLVYDVAVQAAATNGQRSPWSDAAFIATGNNFADALSAAPLAYAGHCPIFLYDSNSPDQSLDPLTRYALTSGGFQGAFLVGGYSVLPDSLLSSLGGIQHVRIAGPDRYFTSKLIAEFSLQTNFFRNDGLTEAAGLATGGNYPDALCAAALCGQLKVPLYLTLDSPDGRVGIYQSLARSHYANVLTKGYVFGGDAVVSPELVDKVTTMGTPTYLENQVVTLVNEERAKVGAPPVQIGPLLQGVADIRADEVFFSFSHTRLNGSECFTAYSEDLAGGSYERYWYLGENIARGYTTPEQVVQAWMDSSGHRANILNPNYTHIGVGLAENWNWVQFFGAS
jgi:uncharacterized protein YkwD/putative cell wall-binding protein